MTGPEQHAPVTVTCECGQVVEHAQWCRAVPKLVMPKGGPEQHAATVREGLKHRQRGTGSTNNTKKYLAALDELVALARDTADELAHLKSEYHFDMDRGDHLVYRGEWERFDRWQRAVASGAAEAVDFVGAEQLAADRVNAAEARADELQEELEAAEAKARWRLEQENHYRERADELQREREGYKRDFLAASERVEQARREADQLRAALRTVDEIEDALAEYFATRDVPMRIRVAVDAFEIASAALAGVQAEEQTT